MTTQSSLSKKSSIPQATTQIVAHVDLYLTTSHLNFLNSFNSFIYKITKNVNIV